MEYTSISNISGKASRIGLGTWAMGGSLWGSADEKESIQTIHRAIDLGINFFDTAPGYGFGVSEEVVGKALQQINGNQQLIIATKCGLNLEKQNFVFRDSRKQSILKEIDDSLRRLQVDAIDLYQIHWPDQDFHQKEVGSIFRELLDKKKIKAIGVCNYSIKEIEEFMENSPLDSVQFPYNLFEAEAKETILPFAKKEKITCLGYSSLCRGLLTGALQENHEFEELRKNFDPKFRKPHFSEYLVCVGRLKQWSLDTYNKSLVALAIRWCLDQGIDIALWGARKPSELDPIEELIDWKLSSKDLNEINQIIKDTIIEPFGPHFMSPPARPKEYQ
jgi:aryl-alcohol dehydrogenase-like predicted oxidoreductase